MEMVKTPEARVQEMSYSHRNALNFSQSSIVFFKERLQTTQCTKSILETVHKIITLIQLLPLLSYYSFKPINKEGTELSKRKKKAKQMNSFFSLVLRSWSHPSGEDLWNLKGNYIVALFPHPLPTAPHSATRRAVPDVLVWIQLPQSWFSSGSRKP